MIYEISIENIQKDLSNRLLLADIIHAVSNIKVQQLYQNPTTSDQSLYTNWANYYLEKANYTKFIQNIQNDLSNGLLLADIIHAVASSFIKMTDILRVYFMKYEISIENIQKDLSNGLLLLADIIHAVANIKVQQLYPNPTTSDQSLHNVLACFQVLHLLGIETSGFTAQGKQLSSLFCYIKYTTDKVFVNIVDSKLKYILGLFFNLSKFKQETKKKLLQQQFTSSTTPTSTSSASAAPFHSSMIKLHKSPLIPNENENQNQNQHIKDKNHLHCQSNQSTLPKPPLRNTISNNNSSSSNVDNSTNNNNNNNNSPLKQNDHKTTTTTPTTTNTTHMNYHHSSLNKQHELMISGQLKSSMKSSIVSMDQCFNISTLNTNHDQPLVGINASLNFTKPNVASLRFPTSSSSSLTSSANSISSGIKPLSPQPTQPPQPQLHQQQQSTIRQSIPRANNNSVNLKVKPQKSNQSNKKSYDYQNSNNHPVISSDTSDSCSNSNNSNLPTTRTHKLQQRSLTTPTSPLLTTTTTTSVAASSKTAVTATSPTTTTITTSSTTTVPSLLLNSKLQRPLNSSHEVVCDSTTDESQHQQQNSSSSEHRSAPVGIGVSYSTKSNISQFKASSFERSGLKSTTSDLNIKQSKSKSSHHHSHHHHHNQKQGNSPSPKHSTTNKIKPDNSYFLSNLSPKLFVEQKTSPTTTLPTPSSTTTAKIISTSTGNISTSPSSTSSGIPMPRHFNLYQQQSTMHTQHPIASPSSSLSSSSASMSSALKMKESPTRCDRIPPYLNVPPHNQSIFDHSLIMNHTTTTTNTTTTPTMSSIDSAYQTTNPHLRTSINQYYHTTPKSYINPIINHDQSIISMNKLSGNILQTTTNPMNATQSMMKPIPTTTTTITTTQEITSHMNYPPPLPPHHSYHHHHHPPPHHHQQQQHHHHQQQQPQYSIQHANTFIPGVNEHPTTTSEHSLATMHPTSSNYLHDARRYTSGNGVVEQRVNQQQHHHLQQQHQQQQHFQSIQQTYHRSTTSSHNTKTSIPPYSSNDTCPTTTTTMNQSVCGAPPAPPTQIHNPAYHHVQHTYTPIIQPFVPPISYRPATQAMNLNFMPITQPYNYMGVTSSPPVVATMSSTSPNTTTTTTTMTHSNTIVNKNNPVVSRRARIHETNQTHNASSHQSSHSIQQTSSTVLVAKTKPDTNVTSTTSTPTTTTTTSTTSTIPTTSVTTMPTNLTYKYLPYMSCQTPHLKEVNHPSSSETTPSNGSTIPRTSTSTSAITSTTPMNTTQVIHTTEQQSPMPINNNHNNPSHCLSSSHKNLNKKSIIDNTEQRRKAHDLYVALKQRYPLTHQSTHNNNHNNNNSINSNHHHSMNNDSIIVKKNNSPEIQTQTKLKMNNESVQSKQPLTEKLSTDKVIKQQNHSNFNKQPLNIESNANNNKHEVENKSQHSQIDLSTPKLNLFEVNSLKVVNMKHLTISSDNNNTPRTIGHHDNILDRLIDCGYQSDSAVEFTNYPVNHSTPPSLINGGVTCYQHPPQWRNSQTMMMIGSLPRNVLLSSPAAAAGNLNLNSMKLSTNSIGANEQYHQRRQCHLEQQQDVKQSQKGEVEEGEEECGKEGNLSNYARRMHKRLQEGMRAAQESLWMPDLPEFTRINRLSRSSSINNNNDNNDSSVTQLSDVITSLSSSINENKQTTETQIEQKASNKIDHLTMNNETLNIEKSSPTSPSLALNSPNTGISSTKSTCLNHHTQTNNNYSSLNSGFHWSNKSGDRESNNSPSLNIPKMNTDDLTNEYPSWDLKKNDVCSDVEDLLNQHERRRMMSISSNDNGKKINELTKFNSASDTEEFLANDYYRIQASSLKSTMPYSSCMTRQDDPMQPSTYNRLRRMTSHDAMKENHFQHRYFIPSRLSNVDGGLIQQQQHQQQQSFLTRVKQRQTDNHPHQHPYQHRSSSSSLSAVVSHHDDNDDAERIYGIVPLSPSYLYSQLMPSNAGLSMMMKGAPAMMMMMSSNHGSSGNSGSHAFNQQNNNNNVFNFPGSISAPPGTPIKLPYATPASLIGTTSGSFSCCPESSDLQIIVNGFGGVNNGSRLSLTSNGSCVSTVEEKQAEEIKKLKRKLEQAEKKVFELTTQLTTNAHVVSAFEQSLNNMSQRLQNLSNTTTKKDSELHELRATIDALRSQTELGFLKKPPINRPCELNRSMIKDTLKQQETICTTTAATTTTSTTNMNTNTTNNASMSENEQTLVNSRLTVSNTSLTDVDSQHSSHMDQSIDKVPSTTSSCKSSGINVKKNGWVKTIRISNNNNNNNNNNN
ncbi:unnamed protein product [Schistosoma turkestanicum]|nr:unnamed protein product [Schistosoma turkestanicum]